MQRTFLMKAVGFNVPEKYRNCKDVTINHHCNAWYGFWMLFCFIFGLFPMIWGVKGMIEYFSGTKTSAEFVAVFFVGVPFWGLAYLLATIMKNAVFVIHPDGIYYRRRSGDGSAYTHEEIRGWKRYRDYLAVVTHSGQIMRIDVASSNYARAEKVIYQRYSEVIW